MRGDGCGIQSQKNRAKARPLQIQGSHYNSYGRFETPNASDKGPVLRQKASVKAKVLLPIQIGEEGGVDFDALPEIAEAKIFIIPAAAFAVGASIAIAVTCLIAAVYLLLGNKRD